VAADGAEGGDGSRERPFATIQAAAAAAAPGDTVRVAKGRYRETVRPARSGTRDNPIRFEAEPGVVIDGTDPVVGWSEADGIASAPMAGDWFSRATPGDGVNLYDPAVRNQADQVFVDGRMMSIARWPNAVPYDPSQPPKAVTERFVGKTRDAATNWTTGVVEDEDFGLRPEAVVGAQIYFQPNWDAWSWLFTGHVTGVEGSRITFRTRSDAGKDFKQTVYADRSRYFLFDKLELLDAPGEWFHDKRAGRLHLKSPDGRPLEGRVAAKRRLFGFDLTERSHIVVEGFGFHACTLTTDRESGGDNVPYDEAGKPRFPWRNAAHGLPKVPYHRDDFRDAPSEGIVVSRCTFEYPSHHTDVSGYFECQWGQSSGVVLSGRDHAILGCTIRFSAGNGIVLLGRRHRALGNRIEDVNTMATDCGAIHTGVTERASSDHEIGWNTVARCGRSGIMIRQMTRSDPGDGSLWKGRVHHNDVSAFGMQDWDLGGICSTGYDGHFVRIDHNWVHDAHENVDNLPGAGGFTAGGIYLDYSHRFLVDHNAIWNVEWGIHLQSQTTGSPTAGFVILHNSVAVRMLGGKPSAHGPYGVVRNKDDAPFQDTLVADNLFLLLDGSARFKPVDFASDPAVRRRVENNVSGSDPAAVGITGRPGPAEAFVPVPGAAALIDRAATREVAPVGGLPVPAWQRAVRGAGADIGAYEEGLVPWRAGADAWPE